MCEEYGVRVDRDFSSGNQIKDLLEERSALLNASMGDCTKAFQPSFVLLLILLIDQKRSQVVQD